MVCVRTEVRQAIAKAIDRSYVTDSVYARHATASTLPVHPDSALYDAELAQELEYDLSALKALELNRKSLTYLLTLRIWPRVPPPTVLLKTWSRLDCG